MAKKGVRIIGGKRYTKKSMWSKIDKKSAERSAQRQRDAGQNARVIKVKNNRGQDAWAVYSTDLRSNRRKRPTKGRNAPYKQITKLMSKAEAERTRKSFSKTQGSAATFQIKQSGSKWAVYAQSKK